MMRKKSTKSEVTQRISIVIAMILRGFTRREIIQNTTNLGWGVSKRQIDTYIRKSYDEIEIESKKFRKYEFSKAIGRLNKLYERLFATEQFTACIGVQKEINKLTNLYESENVNINKTAIETWLTIQKDKK